MKFPALIAHRGDRAHAPENTLVALRQAAAKGARWVEFDATICAGTDAPPVLFHDVYVGRTTNLPEAKLTATDFATLRGADAGSWFSPAFKGEQVPTLAEALTLCGELNLSVNLEIKIEETEAKDTPEPYDDALAEETARRVITAVNFAGPLLISSFSTPALLHAKDRLPHIPRGYLLHQRWADEKEFCNRLRAIDPQTLNLSQRLLTSAADVANFNALAEQMLGRRLPILCYTVNDPQRALELLNWGVTSIFTDDPAGLFSAFKASGQHREYSL